MTKILMVHILCLGITLFPLLYSIGRYIPHCCYYLPEINRFSPPPREKKRWAFIATRVRGGRGGVMCYASFRDELLFLDLENLQVPRKTQHCLTCLIYSSSIFSDMVIRIPGFEKTWRFVKGSRLCVRERWYTRQKVPTGFLLWEHDQRTSPAVEL